MFFFKACPRCGGDMYLNRDMYGAYTQCVQCGCVLYIQEEKETVAVAAKEKAA